MSCYPKGKIENENILEIIIARGGKESERESGYSRGENKKCGIKKMDKIEY